MEPSFFATGFLGQLRSNVEAWRSCEIDYIDFAERQQTIWCQIAECGLGVEAAVFLSLEQVKPHALARQMTIHAPIERAPNAGLFQLPAFLLRRYYLTSEATVCGDQILRATPIHAAAASQGDLIYLIHDLAQEVACHSYGARATWEIIAAPARACVEIRLTRRSDARLAAQVAANILASVP